MPYLPVDLDGRRSCQKAAAVLGVHPGEVSWALQEVWEHVWRAHFAGKADADILTELVLFGCLGTLGAKSRAAEVLVGFDFLDPTDGGYRVRGAAKWLFGMDGQARAGKARAAGARRDPAGRLMPRNPAAIQPEASLAGQNEPKTSSQVSSQTPALTPNTQHPTPKEEETEALSAGADASGPAALQKLWNETAHPSLPRWKDLTEKRRTKAKSRLAERPLEAWREVIARISASAFCRGETDRGNWRASPDWLLQPDTATKVLEGKYDDRQGPAPPGRAVDTRRAPVRAEDIPKEAFAQVGDVSNAF